jgi:hypothetical protein
MPTTPFIGRDGRTGNTKLGGYAKADRLDGDIRRFALGPSMTARQRLTVVGFEPEGASGR